jgi:hypothetical protein
VGTIDTNSFNIKNILRSAHTVLVICFVWISEQTANTAVKETSADINKYDHELTTLVLQNMHVVLS